MTRGQRPRKSTLLLLLLVICFSCSLWYNCDYVAKYPRPRWRWLPESQFFNSTATTNDSASFLSRDNPYNMSLLAPNDMETLVDLQNFKFLINNRRCDNATEVFLLVFVHSAPTHSIQRKAIRETWGREKNLPWGMRVLFFVGETASSDIQLEIEAENLLYTDIIQGNFHDSYRNLTYKHIMGLKWLTYFCQKAVYVLKADDDVFIDVLQLSLYVQRTFGVVAPPKLLFCFVYENSYVKRSRRSKWFVSFREYPGTYYPNYCSGWTVLMSPDVVFDLYLESSQLPFFWVDDVHVTGILASRIGIQHKAFNEYFSVTKEQVTTWLANDEDVYPLIFSYPDTEIDVIYQMWNKTKRFYERNRSS